MKEITKRELENELFYNLDHILKYNFYDDVKQIIDNYTKQMCELQKIECLNNAESHFTYSGFVYNEDDSGYKDVETYVKKESILNAKNVCNG